MATVSQWTPFGVALDITATAATVTRTSATKYTVKINASWKTHWSGAQTNYTMVASSGGSSVTLNKLGNTSSGSSGSFTGTYSISGNSSATKSVTVTFKNSNSDNGDSASKSVSFNVTVPAWTSYTIKYNANGGSGAPSSQTKWKNQAITLSSTKPTRTGYTFSKWNTKADGSGTSYAAGASYTANAAVTLYAQWTAITYTITYNANGGTLGSVTSQKKTYGVALKLTGTATRTNYNFLGWSTNKTATSATYATGASFTTNANTTLYAVWELGYKKPRITSLSADRCTSDGTISDEGTYGLVRFNWATDTTVSSVTIKWKLSSSSSWSSKTVSSSGTDGVVSEIIGDGNLATDGTYDVQVEVADSNGSLQKSKTIQGTAFPIDIKNGATGIAFGGPATIDDVADVFYSIIARKDLEFYTNAKVIRGTKPDGTLCEVFAPQNTSGNTVIGYGNYDNKNGNTNIYGYDVYIGISNIASPGYYRPYRRQGDTMTFNGVRTAGYVTNSGKQVSFWIPLAVPIVGSPTITATSVDGFVLRQGNAYTHGSGASTYVTPDSYSVSRTQFAGVWVTANFTTTTNVTNNDAIGIYWSGTLTFS